MQNLIKKTTGLVAAAAALAVPSFVGAVSLGLEWGTGTGLGTQDVQTSIMNIINIILGFLGMVAVIIVLMGGFKWMTAAGNEDKIGEAKKLITNGVIGLVIVLAAYALTLFVVNALVNATGA